jgi:hypothetical protein
MYVAPAITTMTPSISASIRSSSAVFDAANPRSTTNFNPWPTASTAPAATDETDRRRRSPRAGTAAGSARYGRPSSTR